MSVRHKWSYIREDFKSSLTERHFIEKSGGPTPGHLQMTKVMVQYNYVKKEHLTSTFRLHRKRNAASVYDAYLLNSLKCKGISAKRP
jgi:hypothetical protein